MLPIFRQRSKCLQTLYSATCFAIVLTCSSVQQQVGLKHPLEDEDVVQIVLKVWRLQITYLHACLYAV